MNGATVTDPTSASPTTRRATASPHEEDLRREAEEIRHFLGHDLKSPLGFISGMAELLLMGRYGELSGEATRMLGEIMHQADRVTEGLDQVIVAHRLSIGDSRLRLADVDIWELCERVASGAQSTAVEHRSRLSVTAPNEAGVARVDRRLVQLAIGNLVGHAIRQAGADGDVSLSVVQRPDDLEICVQRGAQSPVENVRETETSNDSGSDPQLAESGLPLRFSRLVAEAHGGSLASEPNAAGGPTFRMRLPIA